MTLLPCCLYLLLILLVGYTLLSVVHPSNQITIVQLIGLEIGRASCRERV